MSIFVQIKKVTSALCNLPPKRDMINQCYFFLLFFGNTHPLCEATT